ncbi:MAG: hypothetical protein ABR915_09785, partial [Thermoguttaceae bacterium]
MIAGRKRCCSKEKYDMIAFQTSADVSDDRQVTLKVPPEVPVGKHDFVVTVADRSDTVKRPRSSLADWAERNA